MLSIITMLMCVLLLFKVSIKLRAKYTTDYPDTPPELQLVKPHCLSSDLVSNLLEEINQLGKEKIGEVTYETMFK